MQNLGAALQEADLDVLMLLDRSWAKVPYTLM
jgi:hypothetical protein